MNDKIIRYRVVDHYDNICGMDAISKFLELHGFNFEITETPDYIIHFPFGDNYLKYDGVRVFWTGEDVLPDFNVVDYAIGFHYLDFGDRYLRRPLYLDYTDDLKKALVKHDNVDYSSDHKRQFCNFVVSNGNGHKSRADFFEMLSNYKIVDSGGRYLNNVGNLVEDKLEFQKRYKFSIAFENASTPGYTTEKIIQAFAAGTIPIYWGNPLIEREFNSKAFINCHNYKSFDDVIDLIRKIDLDDDLYYQYLREPACTELQKKIIIEADDYLQAFLLNIFSQPYEKAFRRNRNPRGVLYENRLRRQLIDWNFYEGDSWRIIPRSISFFLEKIKEKSNIFLKSN